MLNNSYELPLNTHVITNIYKTCDIKLKEKNSLKIVYLNSRSLKNKLDDITILLDSLKYTIHIISITETWILNDTKHCINIPNYSLILSSRKSRRGGGAALFIHNSVNYFKQNVYCDEYNSFINIKIIHKNITSNVSVIYRPPNNTSSLVDNFFVELDNHLTSLKTKTSLLIGDFNFDIKNKIDKNVQKYQNIVESNGYYFCHDKITRPASSTCLDHVLCNNPNSNISITLFHTDISDHLGTIVEICNLKINKENTKIPNLIKKINYKLVTEELKNYTVNQTDVNKIANNLIHTIKNTENRATSVTILKKKRNKYTASWIDDECVVLINRKNYWFKKHTENRSNEYFKYKYSYWLNRLTTLKRKKRKEYDNIQFEKAAGDSKKNWLYIKNILNGSNMKKNEFFSDQLLSQNQKQEKIDKFNEFYCKVGENMAKKFDSIYFPKTKTSTKFKFILSNKEKTMKLIDNLSNTNSVGPDEISTKVVKSCKEELAENITKLINASLTQGKMPTVLKANRVVPIFKSGNKSDINNFRPISISSPMSKIIETFVNEQLTEYLSFANLNSKNQYGFKKKSNTQATIFDMISEIQSGLDKNKKVVVVFFDLKKAFDSIDRKILLRKLYEYGVTGSEFMWFQSYLCDRSQYSECENFKSNFESINYGVVQGSCLGPTLFSCYMNSLLDNELGGKPFLYADDLALVFSENTMVDLQTIINQDMLKIRSWMNKHKLSVNISKTKYMIFKSKTTSRIDIKYDNCNIEMVGEYKYLGVIIDCNLSWSPQITEQIKKGRKIAGIFRLISQRIPDNFKRSVYFSMFHSTIAYGIQVWGNTYQKDIKAIQNIQNKAIKNLFGYKLRTPTKLIHSNHKLLPINLLVKCKLATQAHLIINKNINTVIIPQTNNCCHHYNTRTAVNIKITSTKVRFNNYDAIYNLAYKYFNDLPREIKNIIEFSIFKKKINEFFLSLI